MAGYSLLEALLGYRPRVDVLLEREDGSRRLWIEFEVSRADPVANHAKFATAHLFQPQAEADSFLAMVSPHVARGRRSLIHFAGNLTGLWPACSRPLTGFRSTEKAWNQQRKTATGR